LRFELNIPTDMTRSDNQIGADYTKRRREDPILSRRIRAALGDARSVVNVGAGAGSYEPDDLVVIAVEPSAAMASRRPLARPAIRGEARELPLHDDSVDAAMAVMSLHHWHPYQECGVRELCRVARDCVIIVTFDPSVSGAMWLMADYLTEGRDLDYQICPSPTTVASWLACDTSVEVVPVPRNTPDQTLLSFWAHPERVLDPAARAATWGFSGQPSSVVDRVVRDVKADLHSGAWDAAHGELRNLDTFDAGLRIIRGQIS